MRPQGRPLSFQPDCVSQVLPGGDDEPKPLWPRGGCDAKRPEKLVKLASSLAIKPHQTKRRRAVLAAGRTRRYLVPCVPDRLTEKRFVGCVVDDKHDTVGRHHTD